MLCSLINTSLAVNGAKQGLFPVVRIRVTRQGKEIMGKYSSRNKISPPYETLYARPADLVKELPTIFLSFITRSRCLEQQKTYTFSAPMFRQRPGKSDFSCSYNLILRNTGDCFSLKPGVCLTLGWRTSSAEGPGPAARDLVQ